MAAPVIESVTAVQRDTSATFLVDVKPTVLDPDGDNLTLTVDSNGFVRSLDTSSWDKDTSDDVADSDLFWPLTAKEIGDEKKRQKTA